MQFQQTLPVIYTYSPTSGTLDDFSVQIDDGRPFPPAAEGGITVVLRRGDRTEERPARGGRAVKVARENDTLNVVWQYDLEGKPLQVTWRYRILGKALLVSARCDQPRVSRFSLGEVGSVPLRNALFESGYLAVSPDIDEVLPNVPHPASPYLPVLGPRIMLDVWGHHKGHVAQRIRYQSGLTLWVNCRDEPWPVEGRTLPQWGFLALGPETDVSTALHHGKVADYAECPEYVFADARTEFKAKYLLTRIGHRAPAAVVQVPGRQPRPGDVRVDRQ